MNKVIEIPVIFYEVGVIGTGDGDFIGKSPEADGSVIVIL